jgi:hypothetical protein
MDNASRSPLMKNLLLQVGRSHREYATATRSSRHKEAKEGPEEPEGSRGIKG